MVTVWTVLAVEMAVALVAAIVATRLVYRRVRSSRRRSDLGGVVRPVDAATRRESRDLERV